jgi:hypothetical protein
MGAGASADKGLALVFVPYLLWRSFRKCVFLNAGIRLRGIVQTFATTIDTQGDSALQHATP